MHSLTYGIAAWLAVAQAPLAPTGDAGAIESYYVLVFGAQRPKFNQPDHTHSWATFVRVLHEPGKPAHAEPFTVSWMPANLVVRPSALFPEPGVNLELQRTLQWASDDCLRVSMWGPYQIDKCLFDRALVKISRLHSGEVRYKAVDIGRDSARVCNCIHALADISEGPRLRVGQPGWGESASYFVALGYRPFMVDEYRTHDWLLDALYLTNAPVVRRDLEDNPTGGLLLRGAQNLLQYRLRR